MTGVNRHRLQAERDMQQKLSLIRQIHAAETCGVPRKSCVDLTATSGAQLLSEMSIVEVGLTFQKVSSITNMTTHIFFFNVSYLPFYEQNLTFNVRLYVVNTSLNSKTFLFHCD